MPSPTPPVDLFRALADAMRRTGASWYVFGAQAVLIWGRPRLTADIDVTVKLYPEDSGRLVRTMGASGFTLRGVATAEFVEQTRVLPFVHTSSQWPVDVVLAGPGLEERFLRDARLVDVGDDVRVPVIRAEDLIVTKILAGRPKDLDDVRGVLLEQLDRMDEASIRDTLAMLEEALGVSDLLPVLGVELTRARRLRSTRGRRQP